MITHGSLVISLDFEMMWGCHERSTPEKYGTSNIKQVRLVIERMLELFNRYNVHATFATVGLIMCKDKEDAIKHFPINKPTYLDINNSPYRGTYIADIKDSDASLYFAPDVIEILKSNDNIEIATHTFSHYFCWDKGQTTLQFKSDLETAKSVAAENGIDICSIVFPKNQVTADYLETCSKESINVYRGNAAKFFSEPKSKWDDIRNRICRLLDAYINVGGMTSVPYSKIDKTEVPLNIQSSRMMRQYIPQLSLFEGFRLRRIRKEMTYAAKHNQMYHLWWHPHNFGDYVDKNIAFLNEVLKCYSICHDKYGMQSYTMNEMREQLMSNM